MPPLKRTYDQGINTARSKADLLPGECLKIQGGYYKGGNTVDPHKRKGRTVFGNTASNAKIDGVGLAMFESGTSNVLALSGGNIYKAAVGATGSFDAGSTLAGDHISMQHYLDKWYIATGSENRVIDNTGALTEIGMKAPVQRLGVSPQAAGAGSDDYADSHEVDNFTDPANSIDGNVNTYAVGTLSAVGTATHTWAWAGAGVTASHNFVCRFSLAGSQRQQRAGGDEGGGGVTGIKGSGNYGDGGGASDPGFQVVLKFESSVAGGAPWTTIYEGVWETFTAPFIVIHPIDDGKTLSGLRFRATLTYVEGEGQASLRAYDVKIADGSSGSAFSTETGFLYAFAEFDQDTNEMSPLSEVSPRVVLSSASSHDSVDITFPSAVINTGKTTHWVLFRTPDQGGQDQLGRVAFISKDITTWRDDFSDVGGDRTLQPLPLAPYVRLTVEIGLQQNSERPQSTLIDRDSPPPVAFDVIRLFQGSLLGIKKRSLYYCLAGMPGSWPHIYQIPAWSVPDDDTLVNAHELAGTLVLWGPDVMFRVDELARTFSGSFVTLDAKQITGAPGCVGFNAATPLNAGDGSRIAWISDGGVYLTDANRFDSISDDLDWGAWDDVDKSEWVLWWDKRYSLLELIVAESDGTHNQYTFHMDPRQRKPNGMPKITGPTPCGTTQIDGRLVSGVRRVYSGHKSDGKVYLEWSGDTDASNTIDGSGTHRLQIESGNRYEGWNSYQVVDGKLNHSDFGTGQTATVAYFTGRDSSQIESAAPVKTVALDGERGTQVTINKAGEYHREVITHDGPAAGSIRNLELRAMLQGDEGKAAKGAA